MAENQTAWLLQPACTDNNNESLGNVQKKEEEIKVQTNENFVLNLFI